MKAGIYFTGTGPILVLTSYPALDDPLLVEKMAAKGIKKFIACEVDMALVEERYGRKFKDVAKDLHQESDLRVLDYDGHHVFVKFSMKEMGDPVRCEP